MRPLPGSLTDELPYRFSSYKQCCAGKSRASLDGAAFASTLDDCPPLQRISEEDRDNIIIQGIRWYPKPNIAEKSWCIDSFGYYQERT